MAVQPHALAPTSEPRMAQILEEERPKTYDERDFSWGEDVLSAWTAFGLFGGLVIVEGLVLWMALNFSGNNQPLTLVGAALLLGLGGFLPMIWGYTEIGLAFFGAAFTGVVVGTWADISSRSTDLAVVLGLLVVGVALFVTGIVESVKTSRVLSEEE
jgi:hypothetical protein